MKTILPRLVRKFTRLPQISLAGMLFLCLISSAGASTVTVFATGFNNPRGLKFGPDGFLYVAEGGTGGSNSSDTGDQVAAPVGPYTGNATGSRISKVDANGVRTTVIDNLPSSQTTPDVGTNVSGVGDIAFIGNTLYALITGAGASHGVPNFPNGVIQVNTDGTYKMVANLSEYYMTHPVQNPSTTDFEPDGVPYSMIPYNGDFYVVEPNRGSFDKVALDGTITRVLDTSIEFGTVYVPTVVTENAGKFFLGNIDSFNLGGANILRVKANGKTKVLYSGLSNLLGLTIDKKGRFLALENATDDMVSPMTGDLVRIGVNGHRKIIASGLFYPTGIAVGPDGAIYVSNVGYGPAPNGLGQILKITTP